MLLVWMVIFLFLFCLLFSSFPGRESLVHAYRKRKQAGSFGFIRGKQSNGTSVLCCKDPRRCLLCFALPNRAPRASHCVSPGTQKSVLHAHFYLQCSYLFDRVRVWVRARARVKVGVATRGVRCVVIIVRDGDICGEKKKRPKRYE
jgi:hypothetical protein